MSDTRGGVRRHGPFVGALLGDLVGAGLVLLVSLPTWQTVTAPRPRPLADVVVHMSGRDVDSAFTALGLVALAGVVALIATRGVWRQVVGGVLALAGVGLVWRGAGATSAVAASRAQSFVESHRRTVSVDQGAGVHVVVHPMWAVLSIVGGVLVLAAGVVVAVFGRRWRGMSARYAAPAAVETAATAPDASTPAHEPTATAPVRSERSGGGPASGEPTGIEPTGIEPTGTESTNSEVTAAERARAATSLWSALDRGEDPTAGP